MSKSLFLLPFIFIIPSWTAPISNSTNGDVAACLENFYEAAYHQEYNCTSDFDFLEVNLSPQHKSFQTGKSCFLEVVKSECTAAQYNLLSTKYDDFLDVLTHEPNEYKDCSSSYFTYNTLKCKPMIEEFMQKSMMVANLKTKINDSRVLELIDMCKEIQTCVHPTCFSSDVEKMQIDNTCESLEMKNSEFMACMAKIQKTAPDMSGYKCLGGMNFYDNSMNVTMKKITTKRSCLKEIIKDQCGEKALERVDEYIELMLKAVEKAAVAQKDLFLDEADL